MAEQEAESKIQIRQANKEDMSTVAEMIQVILYFLFTDKKDRYSWRSLSKPYA